MYRRSSQHEKDKSKTEANITFNLFSVTTEHIKAV